MASAQSVSTEYEKALEYLAAKGEVYFSFTIKSKQELAGLTKVLSIDNVKDLKVFAYANKKQFGQFVALGYEYTVLPHPGDALPGVKMYAAGIKAAYDYTTYPTYDAYLSLMQGFQTSHPDLCRIVEIGQTVNGRKLLFARISDNVDSTEAEARFMYTSSMHGNETTGYVLMLRLIDYLLTRYGSDSEVANLVNNLEIWINPLANPDGTYAAGNGTVNGSKRTNANNVDINRNFPGPESPHPDGEAYQLETQAFIGIAARYRFVMSCNFHGGTEVINYPWDVWQRRHADDAWYQYVSHEYADLAQGASGSSYMTGFNDGITNGYDWYTVTGSRQDYMNYFASCREVTIEISTVQLLPESELDRHWNYNYRSFLAYMKESILGIRGKVTDGTTNQPVEAKIEITGHDLDNSFVYSGNSFGDFYRPIFGGTYTLTASADGYASQTARVTVANGNFVTADIKLYKNGVTPPPATSLGDVNGNNAIDIVDALLVAQYYVGLSPANFNAGNADVNRDGKIDIIDGLRIAQCYVGLVSCVF